MTLRVRGDNPRDEMSHPGDTPLIDQINSSISSGRQTSGSRSRRDHGTSRNWAFAWKASETLTGELEQPIDSAEIWGADFEVK